MDRRDKEIDAGRNEGLSRLRCCGHSGESGRSLEGRIAVVGMIPSPNAHDDVKCWPSGLKLDQFGDIVVFAGAGVIRFWKSGKPALWLLLEPAKAVNQVGDAIAGDSRDIKAARLDSRVAR